jgi:hypothetical protein
LALQVAWKINRSLKWTANRAAQSAAVRDSAAALLQEVPHPEFFDLFDVLCTNEYEENTEADGFGMPSPKRREQQNSAIASLRQKIPQIEGQIRAVEQLLQQAVRASVAPKSVDSFFAVSLNEIKILVNGLTNRDALLFRFLACLNDSRLLRVYLDRLVTCGFDHIRKVPDRLALSFSVLVPLQVVAAFRMVFVTARNEDVVADDLSVSLDDGGELPRLADSNLLENIDPLRVLFGPSHSASLSGEDVTVDWGFGQTEEEWTPKRTPKEVSD